MFCILYFLTDPYADSQPVVSHFFSQVNCTAVLETKDVLKKSQALLCFKTICIYLKEETCLNTWPRNPKYVEYTQKYSSSLFKIAVGLVQMGAATDIFFTLL